jgi:hypothetical protein
MEITPIESTKHYDVLNRIELLLDTNPIPKSSDGNLLRTMLDTVRAYEEIHFPIPTAD